MKVNVEINNGIEALFGTRDENIRLLETGLSVQTRIVNDSIEIEGDDANVLRAESILVDYATLVREGHVFPNGDLNSYLRVTVEDPTVTLRSLVQSGRQRNFGKKTLAPKTINQRRYVDAIEHYDLVFGIGPAGTGKTYLAVAMAVSAFLNKKVSRIILTGRRSRQGKSSASCRGLCRKKSTRTCGRYTTPCTTWSTPSASKSCSSAATIEIAPIAFMRGRTLNDSFIIVDEAQNATQEQMKMILTRLGFNSKMVVTGDLTQIDLPSGRPSGLLHARDVLRGTDGISMIVFDERDVVRHSLVQRIVRAYDRYSEMTGAGRQLSLKLGDNGQDGAAPDGLPEEVPAPEVPEIREG